MSILSHISGAEQAFEYLEALFTGTNLPYVVVTGSAPGHNHEKSLLNLIYGTNNYLLSGYEPIGGVAASGLPEYPSFYQALYKRDGFSTNDKDTISIRQAKASQDLEKGVPFTTILEKLRQRKYD